MTTTADSFDLNVIPVHVDHVCWSELDGEAILLNLDNGFYYTLNPVGCEVWKLMDGCRTLTEISTEIQAQYDVERKQLQEDVCSLFQQLQQEDLIGIMTE